MGCLRVSEQNLNGARKLTLPGGATREDCVATITRITARSIAQAYKHWGPPGSVDEVYVGGGGSIRGIAAPSAGVKNCPMSEVMNVRI